MFERLFESRAINYQTLFATGGDVEFGNLSNTNVTADNVFQVNAVFSAVSLIADTISTLPIDVFIRRDGARFPFRPAPDWVQKPDVDLPKEAFYNSLIVSLLLDGNAFVRIFSNGSGQIVNMTVLNPTTVEVKRTAIGKLRFKVQGEDRPLSTEEILFIPDVVKPGEVRGVSRFGLHQLGYISLTWICLKRRSIIR